MNTEPPVSENTKNIAWTIGILGSFLIGAGLVWTMHHFTRPDPIAAGRTAERYKNLKEQQAADAEATGNYGWIDQGKGLVRLPVRRALELTLEEWRDPAVARSNLITRVEKATAAPPKAPEKPNIYE